MSIPLPEESIPKDLEASARISNEIEAPEARQFLISFRHYNEDECQVDDGRMKHYALDVVRTLKEAGTSGALTNSKHINNDGRYDQLYRKLINFMPEVEIHELFLTGEFIIKDPRRPGKEKKERVQDGRIFYFKAHDTISIVAIRADHYPTN